VNNDDDGGGRGGGGGGGGDGDGVSRAMGVPWREIFRTNVRRHVVIVTDRYPKHESVVPSSCKGQSWAPRSNS
jgi:hypothetical protein